MAALPKKTPNKVIDIGSGSGSLSIAASQRWKKTQLLTVDIDHRSENEIIRVLAKGNNHRHVLADALCPELHRAVGVDAGTVDVILSNPPYQLARWRPEFESILNRAGLSKQATSAKEVTLDLIFLAQALYLVRPGGHLGLIVPDTFVSGSRTAGTRRAIAETHSIERVIQLPRGAFRRTDAQAYILILTSGKPTNSIVLERVSPEGYWDQPITVAASTAEDRLDYTFHLYNIVPKSGRETSLKDLGVSVTRGRRSSSEVRLSNGIIFHTSSFPTLPGGTVHLNQPKNKNVSEVTAKRGDILVARVDRKLETKVAIVESGEAPISDCVFRLRCNLRLRQRILDGLSSDSGRSQMIARSRGVGARNLSATELLRIRV